MWFRFIAWTGEGTYPSYPAIIQLLNACMLCIIVRCYKLKARGFSGAVLFQRGLRYWEEREAPIPSRGAVLLLRRRWPYSRWALMPDLQRYHDRCRRYTLLWKQLLRWMWVPRFATRPRAVREEHGCLGDEQGMAGLACLDTGIDSSPGVVLPCVERQEIKLDLLYSG